MNTTVKKPRKPRKKKEPFWKQLIGSDNPKLERLVEDLGKSNIDQLVKVGLFGVGTVVVHNLNLAGLVTYFGKTNEYVETGLPYPFGRRIKFPWEQGEKPTWEDKVSEWGLPAILSYILVYKPEAAAKFVDAIVPF